MSHIFISYNRQDRPYVEQVAQFLQEQGFNVWFDARIAPSDEWWDSIEDALNHCVAFIIIMTPAAQKSKWVKREILLADKLGKPVFPLLLEGEEWNFYVHLQHEDVRGNKLPSMHFVNRLKEIAPLNVPSTYNVTDFVTLDKETEAVPTSHPASMNATTTAPNVTAVENTQKYTPTWPLVVGGLIAVPTLVMFGLMNLMEYIDTYLVDIHYQGWIPALGWTLLAAVGVIGLYVREVIIKATRHEYLDQLFVGILWGAYALVGVAGFVILIILTAFFGSQTFDRTLTVLLLSLMIILAGLAVWRSR
ncbi:MAG: hypothetical protein CUN55_11520 [Phototrophicales bacterium]|nr:MAG: hypothetical protein CUN55_11520 [Phototrophicales bacterium]